MTGEKDKAAEPASGDAPAAEDAKALGPARKPLAPALTASSGELLSTATASHPRIGALLGKRRDIGLARIIMLLIVGFLVWANFARLNEVASAPGEVVPQGNVKVIQHLEGGIIRKIHVREGAVVKAGTPLVSLILGVGSLNAAELRAQLDAMLLKRTRLQAEAEGNALAFDPALEKRRAKVAHSERRAYEARRRELNSALETVRKQITQRDQELKELIVKRKTTINDLKLTRRAFAMSRSLLSRGLTSKLEHLERERLLRRLEGEQATLEQSIPKAAAAVQEAHQRLREGTLRFRRAASEELAQTQGLIARTRELYAQATEQKRRTEIKSPIAGVVKNLQTHTIGGVVKPGEPIMEIVPTGDSLVIEARLSPTDRGYVKVGQPAIVKISTYEYIRYGGLDGTVSHIAADANNTKAGEPYFRVIIKTERSDLGQNGTRLPITPGMQATVDIQTGDRSVMHYLLKPVLKLKSEAFRER